MARKKNNQQITPKDALDYQNIAFRDYLAARHLLIDDFLLPGLTLSSFAIEKYFKCILAIKGIRTDKHLDRLEVFKRLLSTNIPFFNKFDEKYLKLLSRVYDLRYYDHIKGEQSIGFYKWQVLGELDYMVNIIESSINKTFKSQYLESINDKRLFRENYISNNINKKDFMERKGLACVLFLNDSIINNVGSKDLVIEMKDINAAPYEGCISSISVSLNKPN